MTDTQVSGSQASQRGNTLRELSKKTAGIGSWVFRVARSDIIEYNFQRDGQGKQACKLRVVLNSLDEGKYAVGLLRPQRGSREELETALSSKWTKGSVWRFSKVAFHNEKPHFVHTPFKLVIDLRVTVAARIFGGDFQPADKAAPSSSVASICDIKLQKGLSHMFDVTGLCEMSPVRRHDTKLGARAIADITIYDGSTTALQKKACIEFTMFSKVGVGGGSPELDLLRDHIDGRRPLSFFGLSVRLSDAGAREVRPTGDFFWEVAAGTKAGELAADTSLQSLDSSQRESLTPSVTWEKKDRDFLAEPSLLTTLALLDTFGADPSYPVVGNVFQLNYVLLEAPTAGETITTNAGDRIWLQKVLCRDATASIELAMRQKPALQLAGLDPESPDALTRFQELVNDGCLQFPLLSSIRVSVEQRRAGGRDGADSNFPAWEQSLNMIIVEACEQDLTMQPNVSYDGLLPCLKQCRSSEDRLVVASLSSIVAAEHYPLAVRDGDVVRPCSKALAVIFATERTLQAGTDSDAIRLTTKNVSDAFCRVTTGCFQLVSLCHRDSKDQLQMYRVTLMS